MLDQQTQQIGEAGQGGLTLQQRANLDRVQRRCNDPLADTELRLGEQFAPSVIRADGSVGLSPEERRWLHQQGQQSPQQTNLA